MFLGFFFYKDSWDVVGELVTRAVLGFFLTLENS